MTAQIIDGKAIALEIKQEIGIDVEQFKQETGVTPHLVAILVGDDPASAVYVGAKQKACEKFGFKSTLHKLSAETTQEELLKLIKECNEDFDVHGILCQLPLPDQIDQKAILDAVTPLKDVDAFHPENVGLIVQERPRFVPCTPYGVQELIVRSGTETEGAHAVVIGRSEMVGKPMASLLMAKGKAANATVTVCHSRTKNLKEIVQSADIIIAAIGSPKFITADMVKPEAVVIDVGTNRVDKKLVGDVDFDAVSEVASAITPVPGGVGPMTITMLLKNTLTAAKIAAGCHQ